MNSSVLSLGQLGTDLYAGGAFTTASGVAATYIAKLSTALPIEIIAFTGEVQENKVAIKWSTASEINNDYFIVEREKGHGNGDWEAIGKVNGTGNSNTVMNYEYLDKNPLTGINYYRLKQTDYDGNFTYSNTITVAIEQFNNLAINISPNPFSTSTTIVVSDKGQGTSEKLNFVMYDLLGREVKHLSFTNSLIHSFTLDRGNLEEGMYFYKINDEKEMIGTGKIIIDNN